jgi:hypothetical protein
VDTWPRSQSAAPARSALLALLAVLLTAGSAAAQFPKLAAVPLADGNGAIHLVDFNQFRLTPPGEPNCNPPHFHARVGNTVTAFDGTVFSDPAPMACGWGQIGALPIRYVVVLPEGDPDWDGLSDVDEEALGLDPAKPDTDGDGVLDGDEDPDGDGLASADELNQHGTDPRDADSNDDGMPDALEVAIATTAADFTVIPVVVNILDKSAPPPDPANPDQRPAGDPELLRDAVEKANVILKQIKVRLVPTRISVLDAADSAPFDPNNNGVVDGEEVDGAFGAGDAEVKDLPGGKGMKIVVALEVSSALGFASGIAKSGRPTILVAYAPLFGKPFGFENLNTPNADGLGVTIAHELMHTFGHNPGAGFAGSGHSPQLDDPTPDEIAATNLMSDSAQERWDLVTQNGVDGITISDRQTAIVQSSGAIPTVGISGRKQSPGELVPFQFGYQTDPSGDSTLAYLDLVGATIASEVDAETIRVEVSVNGLLPASDVFQAAYLLGFNADANSNTGLSGTGVDRSLLLHLRRNATGGPIETTGTVVESPSGFIQGNIPFGSSPEIEVTATRGVIGLADFNGVIVRAEVSKAVFPLQADVVPVTLGAYDAVPGVLRDSADSFVFDRIAYTRVPRLTLVQEAAGPGDDVPFDLAGLSPGASFELAIDQDVVASGVADGTGAFSGSFSWPTGLAPGFYFLTAVDSTAAFAFNAIDGTAPTGDLDFDADLDEGDRLLLVAAFGLTSQQPGYLPEADLDGDGQITFVDYQLWLAAYRAANPPPPPPPATLQTQQTPQGCGLSGVEILAALGVVWSVRSWRRRGR